MFRRALLVLAFACLPAAATAQTCQTIRFAPGSSSGMIEGIAPPDDLLCFRIEVASGQTARARVEGTNMMFSVRNVVDAQDDHTWTTSAGSYDILVSQLFRSVTAQPFRLILSVTGG